MRKLIELKLTNNLEQKMTYQEKISQLLRSDFQDLISSVETQRKRLNNPEIKVKHFPK